MHLGLTVLVAFHTHTHTLLVYTKLKGDQAIVQLIVYILANLAGIGLGVYKFHNMGLLPTAQSDWLEFMEARQVRTYNNPYLQCTNVPTLFSLAFL